MGWLRMAIIYKDYVKFVRVTEREKKLYAARRKMRRLAKAAMEKENAN